MLEEFHSEVFIAMKLSV